MRNTAQQTAQLIGVAFAWVAVACAGANLNDPGPGKRVSVTLATSSYVAGDTVKPVMTNLSNVSVEYAASVCGRTLQREVQGGGWSSVAGPSNVCTAELRYLGAGDSVPLPYRLPQNLPPGVYRISMPEPALKGSTAAAGTISTPPFSVSSTVGSPP